MNEQLVSLAFYLDFIKDQDELNKQDFDNQISDPEGFVVDRINAIGSQKLERRIHNRWKEVWTILPLSQIEAAELYLHAVSHVFNVAVDRLPPSAGVEISPVPTGGLFEKYVVSGCNDDKEAE